MRAFSAAFIGGLCLMALLSCAKSTTPPVGRWEGTFEAPDAMVAVRLEISPKGDIYLSAPDAMDIENVTEDERPAIRQRLADGLASSWGGVESRTLDFDGRVFRKPGGVAPQMEWNPDTKQMTVILYLGMRAAMRVPVHSVRDFSANPWSN